MRSFCRRKWPFDWRSGRHQVGSAYGLEVSLSQLRRQYLLYDDVRDGFRRRFIHLNAGLRDALDSGLGFGSGDMVSAIDEHASQGRIRTQRIYFTFTSAFEWP